MQQADEFQELLLKIDAKERRSKWRLMTLNMLTVIGALALITYSSKSVISAQREVRELKDSVMVLRSERIQVTNELIGLRDSIQGWKQLIDRYDLDFKKFIAKEWADSVSLDRSLAGLERSRTSHTRLITLLKGEKVDVLATIRYYIKRSERDKVVESLRASGFRALWVNNESYRNERSNSIRYNPGVGRETVLAVAMAVMRAGIELRGISPYPEGVIKREQKKYSVEIAYDKNLEKAPALTINDVMNFTYRER